jgi:hypothetical protein
MKDFTLYPEALELKQLGYPQNDYFAWYAHDGLHYDSEYIEEDFTYACCAAPTYSQAFRFFREKGLDVKIEREFDGFYFGFYWTGAAWIPVGSGSFEEVEIKCLRHLIEMFKASRG